MKKIDGLIHYMRAIENDLGVTIIIKDFVGFLGDKTLDLTELKQFYIHESSYCMLIKEQSQLWGQCLHGINLMKEKLEETHKAYLAYCHAGVGEYVVPIIVDDNGFDIVIGAVTIGGFYHPDWVEKRKSLCEVYRIEESLAKEAYSDSFMKNSFKQKQVEEKVGVISEYIGLLCSEAKGLYKEAPKSQFDHNYIIGHAIAYIKKHYREAITLKDVASFCHCSPSYISHNFKQSTGVTLKQYVNNLRVEDGRVLLHHSVLTVTEIAYKVGFKDSNYFTKVFSDNCHCSPRKYRKEVAYEMES